MVCALIAHFDLILQFDCILDMFSLGFLPAIEALDYKILRPK